MDTRFWGPDGWLMLHSTMYYLPEKPSENEKKKLIKFIKLTPKILPCKYCRISMGKYIKSLPIEKYVSTKERAIEWIYKLHNKVNNKLRRQGYCIIANPTLEQVNDQYKKIKTSLEQSGQFIIDKSNDIKQINKTKKIKKGFRNFDKKAKKYTTQELILCNNYIGSIIFNFPNIYSNAFHGDLQGLVSLYNQYIGLALYFMSRVNSKIVEEIKKYIKKNPFQKIFKNTKIINGKIDLDTIMKLYTWYFTLCKTVNNSLDTNGIDITKFTRKFKKYIVRTCTTYKTVNENTKKFNTCRRKIV